MIQILQLGCKQNLVQISFTRFDIVTVFPRGFNYFSRRGNISRLLLKYHITRKEEDGGRLLLALQFHKPLCCH